MENQSKAVLHIGVILSPLGGLDSSALRFLILHLNALQRSFEYELLTCESGDPFIDLLSERDKKKRSDVEAQIPKFLSRYRKYLERLASQYGMKCRQPDHFIVVSATRFSDNFYISHSQELSILALGNWKRYMAPPSMAEFIITLILRESVAIASPTLVEYRHIGTKGCLFDFTMYLDEVRYKVLNGFICEECERDLVSEGFPQLLDDIKRILRKDWIGVPGDPTSPAGIMANLGYDLFFTKGFKPTFWESFFATIQQEGTKELTRIIGGVLIAALLVWLGLSK
jgi:hypothetical protein